MMIRQLTVMILIGLISTTAPAQQAPPGWTADPRTGCRVWNAYPKPNESISWSGECRNRLAEGRGILQWFESGRPTDRYEGEYRSGTRHGRGLQIWADGNRYEGEYLNGTIHGRGTYTWNSGDRYEGEFQNNKPSGRGVYVWANGDRYDGEWLDGEHSGRGVKAWVNGDRYEGQWIKDRAHGQGTFTGKNGTFAGQWSNGCFSQGRREAWVGVTKAQCGFE